MFKIDRTYVLATDWDLRKTLIIRIDSKKEKTPFKVKIDPYQAFL